MKTNKLLIIGLIMASISVQFSCSKDEIKEMSQNGSNFLSDLKDLEGLNDEATRMVNDVQDPDYELSLNANPNFGQLVSNDDILLTGKTPNDLVLYVDNDEYTPVSSDGTWWQTNANFVDYYGKTVDIEIHIGTEEFTFERYIPEPAMAEKLSPQGSMTISRTGNTLTWDADPNNTSEKVAIYYNLYETTGYSSAPYDGDVEVVDDDGSYSIDDLISDTRCKRINLRLMRGNTASFTFDDRKFLFYISSTDHHEYVIED